MSERLPPSPGERLNRAKTIEFNFDGKPVEAFEATRSARPCTRRGVAPLTLQPASKARRCVCSPGNAGSNDGWMLSMRPS